MEEEIHSRKILKCNLPCRSYAWMLWVGKWAHYWQEQQQEVQWGKSLEQGAIWGGCRCSEKSIIFEHFLPKICAMGEYVIEKYSNKWSMKVCEGWKDVIVYKVL